MTEMDAALERVEAETAPPEEADGYKYIEYKLDTKGDPVVDEKGNEIIVSEHLFTAEEPNEGQLTFLLASMGRGMTGSQRVAAVVNFLDAVLDDESADYLNSRLLSRNDPFPPEGIEKIFGHFAAKWFGRPTK